MFLTKPGARNPHLQFLMKMIEMDNIILVIKGVLSDKDLKELLTLSAGLIKQSSSIQMMVVQTVL